MTKKQLENRYGVRIVRDTFLNEYRIYAADDCPWENGLRTIAACERECKEWARQLLAIKDGVAKHGRCY